MNFKKTILIDLDGVLNIYEGNFDKDFIPPIKEGAYEFIKELSKDYIIKIFTTRNRILVSEWIIKNNLKGYIDDITNVKELSYLIVDDRCINFDGNYNNLKQQIDNFKTWYKK
ncbi:hypothetical protein J6P92_08500 [bacterium]|nr:hypothetical protein [bacterium]